jgi:hypothetical protein
MRAEGICGATRAKKRCTTKSDPSHVRAPDLALLPPADASLSYYLMVI